MAIYKYDFGTNQLELHERSEGSDLSDGDEMHRCAACGFEANTRRAIEKHFPCKEFCFDIDLKEAMAQSRWSSSDGSVSDGADAAAAEDKDDPMNLD